MYEKALLKCTKSYKAQEEISSNKELNWDLWSFCTEGKSCSQIIASVNCFIRLQLELEKCIEDNNHIDFSMYKGQRFGENALRGVKSFIKFINNVADSGHVLRSDYSNSTTKVLIDFNCGHRPYWVVPIKYYKDRKCLACIGQCSVQARKDFEEEIVTNGHIMLSEYIDAKSKILIDYNCGHPPTYIEANSYKQGHRCAKCYTDKNLGENNHRYNHTLTEKDRELGRKYSEYYIWTKEVYERDNYTCKSCSKRGTRLNAHHLNGYNWFIEGRTSIDNGITLCKECHEDFHSIYGKGNNTIEQYREWDKSYKNME